MANGKAPVFYHVGLPTGKDLRIHIEGTPTKKQIRTGRGSKLAITEANPALKIGSKITLYEVSVVQAGKKTTSVYAIDILTAQAQQQRLMNTRTKALWLIVTNMIEYLLTDLMIVIGAALLTQYLRRNSETNQVLVANTQASYVQLPK